MFHLPFHSNKISCFLLWTGARLLAGALWLMMCVRQWQPHNTTWRHKYVTGQRGCTTAKHSSESHLGTLPDIFCGKQKDRRRRPGDISSWHRGENYVIYLRRPVDSFRRFCGDQNQLSFKRLPLPCSNYPCLHLPRAE